MLPERTKELARNRGSPYPCWWGWAWSGRENPAVQHAGLDAWRTEVAGCQASSTLRNAPLRDSCGDGHRIDGTFRAAPRSRPVPGLCWSQET
jgi:hypothetical protein